MRAIQGALIIASTIQIILGFSGLWRNAARMLSPLLAVPLVALAGFGLYEFGFPGVARCVEIGLPQLIILVLLSQQDKDMESKDLLEEETWIRMECILCILDVEHHKSMDLRQRSRIRWASLVCMIDKACEVATIADAVYGVWAKYRLQVTGRPPLEEVLEARKKKDEICNDSKSCRM